MIRHVIMYPLTDPSPQAVMRVRASFQRLAALPQVTAAEFGTRATNADGSLDVAAVLTFEGPAELEAFQAETAHAEHVALMREAAGGVSFVDFVPEVLKDPETEPGVP